MMYYLLTLEEATGLYQGLALAQEIRTDVIGRWVPLALLLGGCVAIYLQAFTGKEQVASVLKPLLWHLGTWSLLAVLFWPETTTLSGVSRLVGGDQIASYAASQDASASMITAADTREVSSAPVLETPGLRLLLGFMTEYPLSLALRINQETHRAFSPLLGMSWLLGMAMTADVTRALEDWVEACWKPSMTQDQEFQRAIRAQDFSPWGDSPVAQALATRAVVPGAMTGKGYLRTQTPLGLMFLANPGSPTTVNCLTYLRAVELDVQRWLFTERSPNGTPLSQVFQEDVGWDVEAQARFLIQREIMQAMGRPSPAPSLTGAYATAAGTQGLLGLLTGGPKGAIAQGTRLMHTFTTWLGLATWFVFWAPWIFGTTLYVLIALHPVVICWSWIPGAGLKPLVAHSMALLYVLMSPVWFAIVDRLARAARSQAPETLDPILQGLGINLASAELNGVIVTVIGLAIVNPVGASVLFLGARMAVNWYRH